MKSGWHLIKGLGRYTNATARFGDGVKLVLTRERFRAIQKDKTGELELCTIQEIKKHFPRAQQGEQFVEVWGFDQQEPWYLLGTAAYMRYLKTEEQNVA